MLQCSLWFWMVKSIIPYVSLYPTLKHWVCTNGLSKTGVSRLLERGDGGTWRRVKEGGIETCFSKNIIFTFFSPKGPGFPCYCRVGKPGVWTSGVQRKLFFIFCTLTNPRQFSLPPPASPRGGREETPVSLEITRPPIFMLATSCHVSLARHSRC